MPSKFFLFGFLTILFALSVVKAQSQSFEIANDKYKVSYSRNSLSISRTGSKVPFLDEIQLISKSG